MPSRASALALRLQTKLRERARQICGRLTRTPQAGYFGHPVNAMTNTFPERHSATALMMAAILVMAAATFDLVDGAVSQNPVLFIAGILFACSGALLFDFRKQNPR
jgi:LPXTG-motif cell wall-anchored protein